MCFFCDKAAGYREQLRTVSTKSAGKSLRVKLSTAVDLKDAHAIDIKYHKKCWGNNVSTVLCRQSADTKPSEASIAAEIAAKIEFLTTTEIALKSGKVLIMSELQAAYDSILKENGADNKICSHKVLKQLIQSEIEEVEFHKSKRVNESERVTIKATRYSCPVVKPGK